MYIFLPPLGCSPTGVVLGSEAPPTRAKAPEGVWRRPYSLALGHGRAGGERQRYGQKVPRNFFQLAVMPAEGVSCHRCGQRGACIEQRNREKSIEPT